MIISIIVATDKNNGIGKDNKIPWYIPYDLKNFKKLTTNHCVFMGRKTFESIGKILPSRINIILTNNENYVNENCTIVSSIMDGISYAKNINENELFIIGGETLYNQTINIADKIYLSKIKSNYNCNVFFPKIDYSKWEIVEETKLIDYDYKVLRQIK